MARRACWRGLNRQAVPTPVKPLIGFSDITALHLWMQSRGFMSIHGPVLTQLGRLPDSTAARNAATVCFSYGLNSRLNDVVVEIGGPLLPISF